MLMRNTGHEAEQALTTAPVGRMQLGHLSGGLADVDAR